MSSREEFEKVLSLYVKEFGWDAALESIKAGFVKLGFTLVDTVLLEDGATRVAYTHPDGSTAIFTEVINDQPNRDSNQHEK